MQKKNNYILLGINILALILILIIAFLSINVLRIILGLPLVLFFPGYTLLAALFPRKGTMEGTERFALSLGVSIAVVLLIGLALNYTSWGIKLYPLLISIFIFIFIMSAIAWYHGRGFLVESNSAPAASAKQSSIQSFWSSQTLRNKIFIVVLTLLILGTLGTVGYVISIPKSQDKYSEFYVLDAQGNAESYPSTVSLEQNIEVNLGIVNHENQPTVYKIEMNINGANAGNIGPFNLNNEETWEQLVNVTPTQVGSNQKVEFLLYEGTETAPSQTLFIWVNVTGS